MWQLKVQKSKIIFKSVFSGFLPYVQFMEGNLLLWPHTAFIENTAGISIVSQCICMASFRNIVFVTLNI